MGKLTTAEVRKAAGAAVRFAKPRKPRELSFAIPEGLDPAAATRAVVEGAYIGDFDPDNIALTVRTRVSSNSASLPAAGLEAAPEAGLREERGPGRGAELPAPCQSAGQRNDAHRAGPEGRGNVRAIRPEL